MTEKLAHLQSRFLALETQQRNSVKERLDYLIRNFTSYEGYFKEIEHYNKGENSSSDAQKQKNS